MNRKLIIKRSNCTNIHCETLIPEVFSFCVFSLEITLKRPRTECQVLRTTNDIFQSFQAFIKLNLFAPCVNINGYPWIQKDSPEKISKNERKKKSPWEQETKREQLLFYFGQKCFSFAHWKKGSTNIFLAFPEDWGISLGTIAREKNIWWIINWNTRHLDPNRFINWCSAAWAALLSLLWPLSEQPTTTTTTTTITLFSVITTSWP